MKRKITASRPVLIFSISLAGIVILAALAWFGARRDHGKAPAALPDATASAATVADTVAASVVPARSAVAASLSGPARPAGSASSGSQAHPFKAAQTNADFGWTAEDGRDTNVIRRLAHNDLEYQRMVNENGTIYRRQLVYHPEGFTLLAQKAVQSGQSIQQMTLPGLDGQVLPVEVTKTDLESGGDRGIFYGKLPGRPDSMVTLAFINGREAFTIISSQDQIFLQAEAREPGELVVKSINPLTYASGSCGNN